MPRSFPPLNVWGLVDGTYDTLSGFVSASDVFRAIPGVFFERILSRSGRYPVVKKSPAHRLDNC
jgi:hypothetical protein